MVQPCRLVQSANDASFLLLYRFLRSCHCLVFRDKHCHLTAVPLLLLCCSTCTCCWIASLVLKIASLLPSVVSAAFSLRSCFLLLWLILHKSLTCLLCYLIYCSLWYGIFVPKFIFFKGAILFLIILMIMVRFSLFNALYAQEKVHTFCVCGIALGRFVSFFKGKV